MGASIAAALTWLFTTSAGQFVLTVAISLISADQQRRSLSHQTEDARNAYNNALQDRSITAVRAVPAWRVVYGRCITGGDIRAILTTDKTATKASGGTYTKPDAYKHLVVSFADHECQALNEVYLAGVAVGLSSLDSNGWSTVADFTKGAETVYQEVSLANGASFTAPSAITVNNVYTNYDKDAGYTAGTYTLTNSNKTITNTSGVTATMVFTYSQTQSYVRVSWHLGAPGQTVDTYLNSVCPSSGAGNWDSNHKLLDKAYAVITLDLENTQFQGGPPGITFDVSGKKLYDPRTSTTYFNSNPALAIRDFLTGEYGYRCDTSDIDDTYTNAAADACDALIDLTIGAVTSVNVKTFQCDGVYTTDMDKEQQLASMCGTMCGQAYYGAKWMMAAGVWVTPVMDLGEDDLHGQIAIVQADEGLDSLYNGIRGTYIDLANAAPSDFDQYQNSTYVTADGAELWNDITLPFTTNRARCRNIARIQTEQNRHGQVITFPAKLRAWPLQIADRVRVTNAEYGYSNAYFRVTDWQFDQTSAVVLTLRSDDPSIYDLADAATANVSPSTGLANPNVVPALSSLAASSGVADQAQGSTVQRVRVTWTLTTDPYVSTGGKIHIDWRRTVIDAADVWQSVEVDGGSTQAFLVGVETGNVISIVAYAINSYGKIGPQSVLLHQVSYALFALTVSKNNLIDPSWWAPGVALKWTQNGTGSGENMIVWGTGPGGNSQAVWKCVAKDSPEIDADGGWNPGTPTNSFPVDPTKTYRFTVCAFKGVTGGANAFFGPPADGSVCDLNTTTANSNPYFVGGLSLTAGKWYLFIGYVFPAGSTGVPTDQSGYYDLDTGEFTAGTSYCWAAATTVSGTRAYQYYASTDSDMFFANPMVNIVDGSEPKLINDTGQIIASAATEVVKFFDATGITESNLG